MSPTNALGNLIFLSTCYSYKENRPANCGQCAGLLPHSEERRLLLNATRLEPKIFEPRPSLETRKIEIAIISLKSINNIHVHWKGSPRGTAEIQAPLYANISKPQTLYNLTVEIETIFTRMNIKTVLTIAVCLSPILKSTPKTSYPLITSSQQETSTQNMRYETTSPLIQTGTNFVTAPTLTTTIDLSKHVPREPINANRV